MAIVKTIRLDNCTVHIHDDCFEDEESVQRRLQVVRQIIMEAYKEQALRLVEDVNSRKRDKNGSD